MLAQLPPNFGADVIGVSTASVIIAVGLVSFAMAVTVDIGKRRPLVSLGAFAILYGVRLAANIPTALIVGSGSLWPAFLRDGITYVVPLPAFVLFYDLVGVTWDRLVRIGIAVQATYAVAAITIDLVMRMPGTAMAPNAPLVIAIALLFLPRILRSNEKEAYEIRPLRIGIAVFMMFALNENLTALGLLDSRLGLEPIGMLVFLAGVGISISRRVAATRRRLAEVEGEIEAARRIQQSILPRSMPVVAGLDIAAVQIPATAVGGDFFDFVPSGDRCLGVLVADVSGHGVPAALIAAMVKMASVSLRDLSSVPSEMLSSMNRVLCGQIERGFVTAGFLWLDLDRRVIRWSRAGHPAALLVHPGGRVEPLESGGPILGRFPGAEFAGVEVSLPDRGRIVLFTDGVVETRRSDGEAFGEERLERLIRARDTSAAGWVEAVIAEMRAFVSQPTGSFDDDVTIVVIDFESSRGLGEGRPDAGVDGDDPNENGVPLGR